MIRRLAIALCAALLAPPTAARAQTASPLQPAFGATIVATYPDGRTSELWLRPDGSYAAKGRRGYPSSGRWRLEGRQVCLSQGRPFPVPFAFCTPVPSGAAGATWSATSYSGDKVRVRLFKGPG